MKKLEGEVETPAQQPGRTAVKRMTVGKRYGFTREWQGEKHREKRAGTGTAGERSSSAYSGLPGERTREADLCAVMQTQGKPRFRTYRIQKPV